MKANENGIYSEKGTHTHVSNGNGFAAANDISERLNQYEYEDDKHKTRKMSRIHYRSASKGYWVAFLLPVALYLSDLKFGGQSKTVVSVITIHAFLLCLFSWMELNLAVLLKRLRKVNLVLTVITMMICFVRGGNLYEYASYVALNFTFPYVFYNFNKHYPKSFTFGEAVLVTSAFVYNFWGASQNVPFPPSPIRSQPESVLVSLFLHGIFFVTILICRIVLLMQKPWKLYVLEEVFCLWSKHCAVAFITRIPYNDETVLWFLTLWPFKFLVATQLRVYMVCYWAAVSLMASIFVMYTNHVRQETTTVDRKFFHFLIVAVFLPGIFWDHTMIFCCSAVLFLLFVIAETIRVLKLEVLHIKIGERVNQTVSGFRDHQDEGSLIITPIYLLVGCALPIWLTGMLHKSPNDLSPLEYSACLSGVLSIGIGDTFASIGGTYYGRSYWRNSRKTVEGTICSILAQVLAAALIFTLDLVPYDTVSVAALMVGIIVNALVEGNTDQIDNLVLPLVTYIVVHVVNHLFNDNKSLV